MNWAYLKEWSYDTPLLRARYREFEVRRWIINVGMWPHSWSLGLMVGPDEIQAGLGPFGLHVY